MSGSQEVARSNEVQQSPKRTVRWSPPGRGSKIFTLEHQEKFFREWRKTRSVNAAAARVGFREGTIFRQYRKSKQFAKKYEEVRMEIVQELDLKLVKFAMGEELPIHNAQTTAIFGVLRAYMPERYRENSKVTLNAEGSLNDLFVGLTAALPKPEGIPEAKPALEHNP